MADYILADKLQAALKEVVFLAVPATVLVTTSESNVQEKTIPNVTCIATGDNAEEYPKGTGNFWMNASVELRTFAVVNVDNTGQPSDPLADRQSLLTGLCQALYTDDIWDQLTAAVTDFTVFPTAVIFESPQVDRDESGVWIDRIPMRVLCCATDLS